MHLDAAEVRDPHETGRVGHDGEVGLVAARVADVNGLEPVRMRVRHALLVEEIAVDAVRMPLHLHRSALDVVQRVRREVGVVLDEVAFRKPARGKEDLLEVGDRDLTLSDAHAVIVRGVRSPPSRCARTASPAVWRRSHPRRAPFGA